MAYNPTTKEKAHANEFNAHGDVLKQKIGGKYPENRKAFIQAARDWFLARGHGPDVEWLIDNLIKEQYTKEIRQGMQSIASRRQCGLR